MKRTEVFKLTNDDWYPNYEDNRVKLIYIGKLTDGKFRVACWGNDDFGIDRDFELEQDAINMFNRLEKYPLINHRDLYDLGFTRF
jgi:hypothetical protein